VPRLPVPQGPLQDDRRPWQPTQALSLNDRGQVLGGTVDPDSRTISGFLLDDGVYTAIDVPGSLSTNSVDINNRSDITGVYADAERTGHRHVRLTLGLSVLDQIDPHSPSLLTLPGGQLPTRHIRPQRAHGDCVSVVRRGPLRPSRPGSLAPSFCAD
jgi:hypothetical protein